MSLRRFLAGPISFGLNAGLAVVAASLLNWEPTQLSFFALAAWGVGLALVSVTLKVGWPILHTSAAGALLVAAASATSTVVWPLPLAGGLVALASARFASVGLASRWLSRTVGVAAVALLALAVYLYATGDLNLSGDGTDALEVLAGAAALVLYGVLGLWHPSDEEAPAED